MLVRDFQADRQGVHRPDAGAVRPPARLVIACVGGGSNAMGMFHPIPVEGVSCWSVSKRRRRHRDRAPRGLAVGRAFRRAARQPYLPAAERDGQIIETHSISAGLDYPGVGPEHAWLKDSGRAEYVGITDAEALKAFHDLCRLEGIIPALESSHALAYAAKLAPTLPKDKILLVNLSGRGDKDMHTVAENPVLIRP